MSVHWNPSLKKAPVVDYRYYHEWLSCERYREIIREERKRKRAAKAAARYQYPDH